MKLYLNIHICCIQNLGLTPRQFFHVLPCKRRSHLKTNNWYSFSSKCKQNPDPRIYHCTSLVGISQCWIIYHDWWPHNVRNFFLSPKPCNKNRRSRKEIYNYGLYTLLTCVDSPNNTVSKYLYAHFTDKNGGKVITEVTLGSNDGRTHFGTKVCNHNAKHIFFFFERPSCKKVLCQVLGIEWWTNRFGHCPCTAHSFEVKTASLNLGSFLNVPRGSYI